MKRETFTAVAARAILAEKPKRSKYKVRTDAAGRAARTMLVDGKPVVFDSVGEMNRWCELVLLEKAGKITDLHRQVPTILQGKFMACVNGKARTIREIKYVLDFTYTEGAQLVLEDFKGPETDVYKLHKKMLLHRMRPGRTLRISHANGDREDFTR